MELAQTTPSHPETACQRNLGRAEVAVDAVLQDPRGRFACTISDLSLSGARIETTRSIEPGQDLWLTIEKLRVFCTVQWQRSGAIGVCFEQKLPKVFVLGLLGETVDRDALKEAEAMLAARDWVMGGQAPRPRNLSLADLLGARHSRDDTSGYLGGGLQWIFRSGKPEGRSRHSGRKKVAYLFMYSGLIGSFLGLSSSLFF
jgi:hypothetical protein